MAQVIAEIRADLGLDTAPGMEFWKRRTPADVAVLCARAAAATPVRLRAGTGVARNLPPGACMMGSDVLAGLDDADLDRLRHAAGPADP